MLLEGRRSLRFTKLEKRSPTMAKVATRVPTFHPSPISAAQDGRRQHGHHDAADGFRGSEYGLAIDKESAAVERAAKRSSQELLSDDSRPVGHDQQDQQLQQQRALHKRRPIATIETEVSYRS